MGHEDNWIWAELPNGSKVRLPGPVREAFSSGGVIFVIVETSPPKTITDNVFCFAEDGRFIWRIEDLLNSEGGQFDTGRVRKDGLLEFYNNDGCWMSVDPATGLATGIRACRFFATPESPGDLDDYQPISIMRKKL